MKTPFEYRTQAREFLQNRWGEAAIVSAIILAAACIVSTPSIIGITHASTDKLSSDSYSSITTLLAILVIPIQYALYIALLQLTRGSEQSLTEATKQYSLKHYGRFFSAGMVITLLSAIAGAFTLGIGSIILSYMYRMVPYLLHDYPELTTREAMKISRQMMAGYKWELFLLDLSFLPWFLLSIITLGLGTLLLVPYMQTASALFYEDLKATTIVETADEAQEKTTEE